MKKPRTEVHPRTMKMQMKKPRTGVHPRHRCLGPHCPFGGHEEDKIGMHPRKGKILLHTGFCCGRCRLGDPGHGPLCTLEVHWSLDKEDVIMCAIDQWDDGRPGNAEPSPDGDL